MADMEKKKVLCTKHPRYTGQRMPTGTCHTCWQAYIEAHPVLLAEVQKAMDVAFARGIAAERKQASSSRVEEREDKSTVVVYSPALTEAVDAFMGKLEVTFDLCHAETEEWSDEVADLLAVALGE